MRLRWFLSSKVRQTGDLCDHVRKLRNAQIDLLSPQAVQAIDDALQQTEAAMAANVDEATLAKRADELEKAANKCIKPYPNTEWRENVEVFLVAIVVAMAIRTFFLQPFKIPTSSMQPTLFGVTVEPLYTPGFKMPGFVERVFDLVAHGAIYHEAIAPQDGFVVGVGVPEHFLRFFNKQSIEVQYQDHSQEQITFWFTPDQTPNDQRFEHRIGLDEHPQFHKGDPIVRFVETTGDHLFVDRLTYNFRKPERGEIVVFKTVNLGALANDQPMGDTNQFYIKRLIGLPGETVSIGEDRHVRINGKRLDASTPHFAGVYSFNPSIPAQADVLLGDQNYNGHILMPDPRSYLRTENDSIVVRPDHYLVFGDNTVSSYDGRYWRDVPQENFIGKALFVYWPITSAAPAPSRFGLVNVR